MILPPAPSGPRRPGFTLLEVVLASTITVLLMAGLYVAINMLYKNADAGRRMVERSTQAQSIMQRLIDDVGLQVAPPLPNTGSSSGSGSGGGSSGSSGTSSGTGSTGTSATPSTGTTGSTGSTGTTGGTGSSSTGSGTTGSTANASGGPVTFNLMVQGDPNHLTLYVSRVPTEVLSRQVDPTMQANLSDLRRISYWLDGSGLARQEIKQETSQDALNTPNFTLDDYTTIISDRVKSLTFSYFDPNSQAWTDTWDGTQVGPDGTTGPQGPPAAIKVEMQIAPPATDPGADDSSTWKTYRQTILIPTANGQQLQAQPQQQQQQQQSTTGMGNS